MYLTHCPDFSLPQPEPCVIAMGFFDGVHIGHQQVIATAKKIAEKRKVKLAVMTFFPHPKEVLSHGKARMAYLTPIETKGENFARLGVDKLYVIKFDMNFAELSPKEFINKYVVGLGAVHVVAGFDFTYGYRGQGNMETISADGNGCFQVTTVSKLEHGGRKISSTLIRELLSKGDVGDIAPYLGDFYETRGEVLLYSRSQKRGSLKAEISTYPYYTLPADGFYEIEAHVENHVYHGVSHVRSKRGGSITMEIELFYLRKNIRDWTIKIKWLNRLSESKKVKMKAN
ncbi:cytidyltransferase [Bacillus songklensis]|uniref:Riboflavin biosynthesis protein n=1 Tax=Bacillus songklensis TaxID=1069116 RepID=A0ABV8B826_9BACI